MHGRRLVHLVAGAGPDWEAAAELTSPVCEGGGHQHLTAKGIDDAIVELSYGEPGAFPAGDQVGRSARIAPAGVGPAAIVLR